MSWLEYNKQFMWNPYIMNEVGFCLVVGSILSSEVLSCGVLSVLGFVLWDFMRTPLCTAIKYNYPIRLDFKS